MKNLISRGASVDVEDEDKCTPLLRASMSDYTNIIKILIDSGANVNVTSTEKKTPLHFSSEVRYNLNLLKIQ